MGDKESKRQRDVGGEHHTSTCFHVEFQSQVKPYYSWYVRSRPDLFVVAPVPPIPQAQAIFGAVEGGDLGWYVRDLVHSGLESTLYNTVAQHRTAAADSMPNLHRRSWRVELTNFHFGMKNWVGD